MIIGLLRQANILLGENKALPTPGVLPSFLAGRTVNLSNPRAMSFHIAILTEFFDLRSLTLIDIRMIFAVIPIAGNIALVILVERTRELLKSATSVRRINVTSGLFLIVVGVVIPFT